jgi:hypothetical protein
MPLSDWRDGDDHLDAEFGSIYNLNYLQGNIAGGEGYDWYYHSPEARAAQIRTLIEDAEHDEPWVWRYKDIRNWWQNAHHERIDGIRQEVPTGWVPESKPIWFTEIGCAAVDKGTNQPNKFLDPKSSESSLPRYSNGLRDEFIQTQYLLAMIGYYENGQNNPSSQEFGHQMVDISRTHVWAWDARPYPYFPNNRDLWSDGENHARGHWITGRTAARTLASVVAEICERSGLAEYDVSRLYGMVRGYQVDNTNMGRSALQPLMLAYGFDAVERDGILIFSSRTGAQTHLLDPDLLALGESDDGLVEAARASAAEVSGRVRIGFVEADGDYEIRSAEAIFPDEVSYSISSSELPLALTEGEGRGIAERWLSEARIARDTVSFALPLSAMDVGAGDVVRLPDYGLFRVDRVEQAGFQQIEAVRIEPETYRPHEGDQDVTNVRSFVSPVPVEATFLDLPLLNGGKVEHAPHLAMTGTAWPGSVALYSAAQDSGYELNQIIAAPATVGETESILLEACTGMWDRGAALRVKLVRGELSTATAEELFSGANLAAIGDGSSDNWEVFQFVEAVLVDTDTYDLTLRLRGQVGSDANIPSDWPVGSRFVLLDGVPAQIELASTARDVTQHYRYGPALRAIDDASYNYEVEAFKGIGLRPYTPCHLKTVEDGFGDLNVNWIRRTRIDGDNWSGLDVPLGEASESYLVRVTKNNVILRETVTNTTQWTYSAGMKTADGVAGAFEVNVAQVSQRFGAGPFKTVTVAA